MFCNLCRSAAPITMAWTVLCWFLGCTTHNGLDSLVLVPWLRHSQWPGQSCARSLAAPLTMAWTVLCWFLGCTTHNGLDSLVLVPWLRHSQWPGQSCAGSLAAERPSDMPSVLQRQTCTNNCVCCHTKMKVAEQTCYLTQSQYTDPRPTSPSADPITPGAWQGSEHSAKFEATGITRPAKTSLAKAGTEARGRYHGGRRPSSDDSFQSNCHSTIGTRQKES